MGGPQQLGVPLGLLSPRRVIAGVVFAAAGAALLWGLWGFKGMDRPERRVAVRVDCTDVEDCILADTVATDVWSEQRGPGLPLDVVIPVGALAGLKAKGVTWTVLDDDIDATARAEAERLSTTMTAAATDAPARWFSEFRDFKSIEARLHSLAEQYPARASLHGIGASVDGRPLWALRIGGQRDDALPMLINGTQHAREWIAAMTATCVADRLVRDYDQDDAVRALVDTTEVWVVPVVNPDGYQYSWGQDRYWRKNRRGGHGVDLNRNHSVAWGGSGSSNSKRAETYRGERPFSEPESSALRDLARREEIRLHVDFHAYGQLVLFPWNHSAKRTDDHARFAAVGDKMASAIFAQHGTRYRLIRGVELYPAAGTMTDYMYGEAGALSYTIELRPRAGSGFVLPPDQIKPTCDEGFAAVLALRAAYPTP
jgi:carboxypeptidase T